MIDALKQPYSFDREPIVASSAKEVMNDCSVLWHAVRGYDFAGLEKILQEGLLPAKNQQDHKVSVSISPRSACDAQLEANSFLAYTLQDGISLAIKLPLSMLPRYSYGGFTDEVRLNSVAPTEIKGLMLPVEALSRPLAQISTARGDTRHETRKPLQAKLFIERTVAHISELGGEVDTATAELVEHCKTISTNGHLLTKEQSTALEINLHRAYSNVFASKLGIPEPTIKDALEVIFKRARVKTRVFTYTDEQKHEIQSRNSQTIAAKLNQNMGRQAIYSKALVLSAS